MPHSSLKNVNAPMDAWDRQRFGIALLEIQGVLSDLLEGLPDDARQMKGLARVRKAVSAAVNEVDSGEGGEFVAMVRVDGSFEAVRIPGLRTGDPVPSKGALTAILEVLDDFFDPTAGRGIEIRSDERKDLAQRIVDRLRAQP